MSLKSTLRMFLRSAKLLAGALLVLILVSCSMGETMMPDLPPGLPADRSAGVVIAVPAPIPHTLDSRQECFTCHAIGAVDAPPVPVDHDEDVTLCTTCHAVWLAPAIAAAAPPAIPHELVDREDCLTCHKLGTAGATRVPENHAGLTSAMCQTCHTSAAEIVGTDGETETPGIEAPAIPHELEGFSACGQCHEQGGAGIPRFPDDHLGRTDDLCSACHRPGSETATEASPTTGDAVNGQVVFAASCAPCHGASGEGTAIAPSALNDAALLAELSDEDLATAIRRGVGDRMPAFPDLSNQEVQDLVALIRSWP